MNRLRPFGPLLATALLLAALPRGAAAAAQNWDTVQVRTVAVAGGVHMLVAHGDVRRRMSVDQFVAAFGDTVRAAPEAALPVVTFTDAVTFFLNGDTIHAFHVPHAHTDGDAIVRFRRANVIHMGDVFFHGRYPFIDLSSGGSVDGMIGTVKRALALANAETKIIPGHGPLATRTDLQAYRDMLVGARDAVRRAMAGGRTLEQVVAAKPAAPG